MDQAIAKTKHVRVSPQKARLAAALIRNRSVEQAKQELDTCGLKAGALLAKTLKSAVANAENELGLRPENMRVVEVRIDGGSTLKRGRPRSRGSSQPILKRSSHFTIIVGS